MPWRWCAGATAIGANPISLSPESADAETGENMM